MRKHCIPMLLAGFMLAGCNNANSGIWMLFLEPNFDPTNVSGLPWAGKPAASTEFCTVEVTQNFKGAVVNDGGQPEESELTSSVGTELSQEVLFGRIFNNSGENKRVLIINDRIYPGKKQDGQWVYTWTNESTTTGEKSHPNGYNATGTRTTSRVTEIALQFSGNTAEGTYTVKHRWVQEGEESDEWDSSGDAPNNGDLPEELEFEREDVDISLQPLTDASDDPLRNAEDTSDCNDSTCFVNVVTECEAAWTLEAVRTKQSEGEFDAVESAGNEAGAL